MGFHRQWTMWLWRNPDNVTHRQLLSIDQVWRRSTALTWSRWGCRRLADNIWLLGHDSNNCLLISPFCSVGLWLLPYTVSINITPPHHCYIIMQVYDGFLAFCYVSYNYFDQLFVVRSAYVAKQLKFECCITSMMCWFITLHAKLSGAVYCYWSCLFVYGFVCLWVCCHDNSNCVHRSSPNWVCRWR